MLRAAAWPGTQGAGCQQGHARNGGRYGPATLCSGRRGYLAWQCGGAQGQAAPLAWARRMAAAKSNPAKPGLSGQADPPLCLQCLLRGFWQGSGAQGRGSEVGRRSMLVACRHAFAHCGAGVHRHQPPSCTLVQPHRSGRAMAGCCAACNMLSTGLQPMQTRWPAMHVLHASDQLHAPPPLLCSLRSGSWMWMVPGCGQQQERMHKQHMRRASCGHQAVCSKVRRSTMCAHSCLLPCCGLSRGLNMSMSSMSMSPGSAKHESLLTLPC